MTAQNFSMVARTPETLALTILGPTNAPLNLTNAQSVTFSITQQSGPTVLTKSLSNGVSILNATAGMVQVTLSTADTNLPGGAYYYQVQVTLGGATTTVAAGIVTVSVPTVLGGTSGTNGFNPPISELTIDAYERCGKMPVELTQQSGMLASARRSMNLVLSSWANKGVNLWKVDQVIQTMIPGQMQYQDDASCIDVLQDSVTIRWWAGGIGQGAYTDLRLYAISRTDWMSLPQKVLQQDRTTSFWVDRQVVPVINVWPQVNSGNTYQLVYDRTRYIQDADFTTAQQLDMPQRFLKAFVSGFAADLAIKWAPERAVALAAAAQADWMEAAAEDEEKVPLYLAPDMSGYYV